MTDPEGPVVRTQHRPILVNVHYGNSAIVRNRPDAVRYGYRESDYRAEFYYLDLSEGPEWVKITEESGEDERGIFAFVDQWVEEGTLTEEQARWAKDQFE